METAKRAAAARRVRVRVLRVLALVLGQLSLVVKQEAGLWHRRQRGAAGHSGGCAVSPRGQQPVLLHQAAAEACRGISSASDKAQPAACALQMLALRLHACRCTDGDESI